MTTSTHYLCVITARQIGCLPTCNLWNCLFSFAIGCCLNGLCERQENEATKSCAKIEWIASAKQRPWRDFKQHQKSLCCVYDVLIIIKFVIDSAWFFPSLGRCGVIYKSWILMTNVLFNIDSHWPAHSQALRNNPEKCLFYSRSSPIFLNCSSESWRWWIVVSWRGFTGWKKLC